MFDLRNVVISVPLPALRDAPSVRQIDGEWRCGICSFIFLSINVSGSHDCFGLEFAVHDLVCLKIDLCYSC